MENKTIQINDFELEVDYEIREPEPENAISAGFDIRKVTIADCDLFKEWRGHFNIFLNDDWEDTFFYEISELISSEEKYRLGLITGLNSFCSKPIVINEIYISQCILENNRFLTYNLLKEHAKKIQDYLCSDMYGTDITEIVDHYSIENELKQ